MTLSSPLYLVLFLPLALCCYYGWPRFQNRLIFIFSLLFYAQAGWQLALILLITIGWTYYWSGKYTGPAASKLTLLLAISVPLLLLTGFKARAAWSGQISLMPAGLSFYAFQAIGFAVDIHNRKVERPGLEKYALSLAFFPQLVAGPIMRLEEMSRQFVSRNLPTKQDLRSGAYLALKGCFYKTAIADELGVLTGKILASLDGQAASIYDISLFAIAFTWQIFFDFQGYSLLAIGSARLFGIELAHNFRHPYLAQSFQEHWQRWHITLSGWLRDYIYIPLGGRTKRLRNLWATMILGGLWHGIGLNFLFWSILHALFLSAEDRLCKIFPDYRLRQKRLMGFSRALFIFSLTVLAMGIFGFQRTGWPVIHFQDIGLSLGLLASSSIVTVAIALLAEKLEKIPGGALRAIFAIAMIGMLAVSGAKEAEFIYYRF